ncbi:hypothetical protein CLU79DRAFT_85878 [Phycomyces nitens]|nr:hypothetical protein CLU79DRAFT_85878 [Phycomyces nitens]
MAIVFFNIVPENDRIQPLDHDIANQTVVVKGYVTLCVSKSVSIGQIRVQIKGVLRSLVSSGLADKIVVGLYESTQVLVRKRRELLDKITRLEPGAHRWPFEIAIDSSKLPDSLDIPHHKITYELSAKLIPSSLTEKVKIGYWEARRRTSSSSNDLTQDVPNAIDSNAQPTTNQWLRTKHRLQVQKHSDNLCGFIDDVPWTKYEGERQGHLSYQPMREEAQVVLVTIAFEQTERYPVHPGEYGPDQSFEDISMRTRTRKIAGKLTLGIRC